MEGFIDKKCNELALGSLKRDAEMKQQNKSSVRGYHYNTSPVKSLKEQIDILQSEVYFLREELQENDNIFKILMKSKISGNKCHHIDANNQNDQNDKIPESAPSELRYTTTNINKNNKKNSINKINSNNNHNHKNVSKNDINEKINNGNINNNMANTINSKLGTKQEQK